MPSNRTLVSDAGTYQEIGEFWDKQDSAEFGGQAEVEFKVDIQLQLGTCVVEQEVLDLLDESSPQ
jgi:hypothetical protein